MGSTLFTANSWVDLDAKSGFYRIFGSRNAHRSCRVPRTVIASNLRCNSSDAKSDSPCHEATGPQRTERALVGDSCRMLWAM